MTIFLHSTEATAHRPQAQEYHHVYMSTCLHVYMFTCLRYILMILGWDQPYQKRGKYIVPDVSGTIQN
jgi:hypothetical protein